MKHLVLILAAIVAYLNAGLASSSCINPFTKIGNKYYYIEKHQKLSWFAAAARCMQLGGQLLTIENERELTEVRKLLVDQGYTGNAKDWLWTSGIGKPGAFLAYGDPLRLLPFEYWDQYEPSDTQGKEDCINIFLKSGALLMNDYTCRTELRFICELAPSTNTSDSFVRSGFIDGA